MAAFTCPRPQKKRRQTGVGRAEWDMWVEKQPTYMQLGIWCQGESCQSCVFLIGCFNRNARRSRFEADSLGRRRNTSDGLQLGPQLADGP